MKETDSSYEVDIDLPGLRKMRSMQSLKTDILPFPLPKALTKDEKDKKGKYIRKERYAGALSRTFYLGEEIREEEN